jgi:sirohydrochlorin cobaltochelatase
MAPGILLFAHGARDAAWARPFEAVLERIRTASPDTPAELAFLEFMSPDIASAARRLAEAGCRQVSVVPLFLGAGGHVRKDLPGLLDELSARHSNVQWTLCPAIGEVPAVIEAMASSALALSQAPSHMPR